MKEGFKYYVYIETNKINSVLYTGVTNDMIRRYYEHRDYANPNSFCTKYKIYKLVYYETYANIGMAIFREKQIKNLVRRKKIELINKINPKWRDLINDFFQ